MGEVRLLINGGGGWVYILYIVITAFCESYHKIDAAILRRSVLQI